MSYQQGGYGQQQGGYSQQGGGGGPPPRRGNFPPVQPEFDPSSAPSQGGGYGDHGYNSRGSTAGGYQQDNGYPPRPSAGSGAYGGQQQDNGYPQRQPAPSQGYDSQPQQNQGGYAQQPAPPSAPVDQQQGWTAQAPQPQQGWNAPSAQGPPAPAQQQQQQWNAPAAQQQQWGALPPAPASAPVEQPPQQQQGWGASAPVQAEQPPQQQQGWGAPAPARAPIQQQQQWNAPSVASPPPAQHQQGWGASAPAPVEQPPQQQQGWGASAPVKAEQPPQQQQGWGPPASAPVPVSVPVEQPPQQQQGWGPQAPAPAPVPASAPSQQQSWGPPPQQAYVAPPSQYGQPQGPPAAPYQPPAQAQYGAPSTQGTPQAQYGQPQGVPTQPPYGAPITPAQPPAQPRAYGAPPSQYGAPPATQACSAPPSAPTPAQQVYPVQPTYGAPPPPAPASTYAPSQSAYPSSQQAAYAPSTQAAYASTQGGFTAPPTPFPPSTVAPTPIQAHAQPQGHGMMPPPGPIPAGMQQGRPEKVRESDFVNPTNDIERKLNELSLKSLNLTSYVARPGFGTQGKPIGVLANIFAARFKDGKGKTIHHYDVEIDPVVKVSSQKKPVTLLRAVWEQLTSEAQGPWAAPFQAAAFDGRKNAFTPIQFPIEGPPGTKHQIIIALPEEGATDADEARRFKIVIKHVADVDLESLADFCRSNSQSQHAEEMMLTAVMSVNVLLRDQPTKKYCSVGASGNRFFGLNGAVDLPGGALVCRGFMQSFRYTNSGNPGVQIDTAYSAFSASGRLLDVAAKILGMGGFMGGGGRGGFGGPPRGGFGGGRGGPPPPFGNHGGGPGGPGFGGPGGPGFGGPGGPPGTPRSGPGDQLQTLQPGDIAMLKSKLKLAKFKVTHRPSSRIFTIMSITQQPAEDITFVLEGKDGAPDRKLDICTYFKEMYGVTVTKPRLPCIAYGRKGFIPMEFVEIEPFHSLPPMRLSSDQTAEMIKVSARPPRERADHIMNWRRELAYEKQQKVAAWGIEINPQMMNIEARVLPPPAVLYAGGQDARANNGSWSLRGKRFVRECTPLKAWSVVSFDRYCDQPKMAAFVARLVNCLRSHGITVETDQPPLLGPFNPNQDGSIRQGLGDAAGGAFRAGGRAPQLVIVLLPGRDQWIYESIKRTAFCDLKAPIPTQCLQTMKLKNERGLDQYCDNVSMKIHVKLGGLTHQVPLSSLPNCDKSTMLVGVDVTHPPPKPGSDMISPSVAVAVATYNETCDAYACQIRLQEGREETCQDLASMMEAHVRLFEGKNGLRPTKLIVFRDGVSEGQYAAVVQTEFDAILRGCRAVHPDYRPQVSFVIAAKRHNMRFFAADPADVDRSGNLPPGLVVDKGVVHPFAFDFYLQAHAGLVGTSRPTHYLALIDEIKFTPDQLHRLVNALCYSFVRATRSVSLIPVAYTADIICSQVRTMIHDGSPSEPTESEYSGGGGFKPRKTRDFDPLKLQNLLAKNPEMASVAWYM